MAEYAVSTVLKTLDRASKHETLILKNFQAKIQLLRDEFQQLDHILKHVQKKYGPSYSLLNWESDIIRAAHGADDLVESFVLKREKSLRKVRKWISVNSIMFPLLSDFAMFPLLRYEIYMQTMRIKIHDIVISFEAYGLSFQDEILNHNSPFQNHHQYPPLRERFSSRASRNHVVGFSEQMQTLMEQLISDDPCSLSSISLTGMGGVGKTTLAQCIYNNTKVKDRFMVQGWVSVSQKFTFKGVLVELLANLTPNGNYKKASLQKLQLRELMSMLYEYLKQTRFLVVLDDVWSVKAWDLLARLFPDNKDNSRLILTTRNNQVALRTGGYTLSMPFKLEEEESWRLFQMKAFDEEVHDPELKEIGQDIISKCDDLPLLIVDVGTFLSRKTLTREWKSIEHNMTPLGPQGKVAHLFDILLLSYKDLAPELRTCFLCLGFFPRNYEIPTRKLFYIWIAHGFVSEDLDEGTSGSQSLERKAESYLQEFIDKNLVQVKKVAVNGKVKTCGLHASIHELCILVAKEESFLEVESTKSSYDHPSNSSPHKVILSNPDRERLPAPNLRSLVFFLPPKASLSRFYKFRQSRLLRVLELEGIVFKYSFEYNVIAMLSNLRYLNLRNTCGIKRLSTRMRDMHMLLILDIRGSEIDSGLSVLQKITSLRHVYLNKHRNRPESKHLSFKTLTQLETVAWISHQELLTIEMQNLRMLRKLKLEISSSSKEAWSKIASLSQLESLHVVGEGKDKNIDIPDEIASSLNIKQLKMKNIKVSPQLVSILGKFPHLMLLHLKESVIDEGCLMIDENGFSNLQFLELSKMEDLVELKLHKEIIRLKITECERLSRLPDGVNVCFQQ